MSNTEPTPIPLTLGRQVAAARQRAGLNQTELGLRWKEHRNTISRWENDGGEPSFSQMVDLAEISGWPLELFARAAAPSNDVPPDQGIARSRWDMQSAGGDVLEGPWGRTTHDDLARAS